MQFIAHRINTVEQLQKIPSDCGIEIDIRDHENDLILQHDPFKSGERFEDLLKKYDHNTIILNIKSEGVEWRVLELLKKYNVENYFFLDCSIPMIISLSKKGISKIAVRFSEFEAIETVMNFRNRVEWVWVDCFSKIPVSKNDYEQLKTAGFKLCFVSPELQGQSEKIKKYRKYLEEEEILFDAVCSKIINYDKWIK